MPNKNKKPGGILPGSEYQEMRSDAAKTQLDIQTQINIQLEKQLLTGEKLTRADKKRAQDLQTELDVRMSTKNELGQSNVINKSTLKLRNDELKTVLKISSGIASVTDLYSEYIKLQEESLKLKKGAKKERASKENQMYLIKREISWQRVNDIQKKYLNDLKSAIPLLAKAGEMVKNPLVITTAVAGGLISMGKDWNEQLESTYKTFGAMGPELETALSSKLQKANKEMAGLDISFKEVAGYVSTISEKFGVSVVDAVDMAYNTAEMSKSLGVSGDELLELENIYINIVGLSRENADLTLKQQMSWLETANVVPQTVLRDMSRNTEFIARYTSKMSTNLLNASAQANKLGVSLSTIDKMSNSVLNFQQSIRDEFELSVLLGKQMDLRQARMAFLSKDTAGGFKALREQLGGIDLKSLDALTVEKLAGTFNMTYEELNKVIQNQGKLNDLESATVETLDDQETSRIKASEAQTKVTENANLTKNMNRLMNEEMVENWSKIEGIAAKYSGILKGVTGWLGSIGALTVGATISTAAVAAKAWSYASAIQAARGGFGGGMGMPNYTGQTPKGTTAWTRFTSAHKDMGLSQKDMQSAYHSQGGRNWEKGLKTTKGGKLGGKLGGGIGFGLGAAALGVGRGMLDEPNSGWGKAMGIGSSALMGASIGSMIPVVGTGVGALLGGLYGAYNEFGNAHSGGITTEGGLLNVLPQEAVIPLDKIGNLTSNNALSSNGGGYDNNIDYDKLAHAVRRGSSSAFKDHGVPNVTDERIWRGTDKANSAWAPPGR